MGFTQLIKVITELPAMFLSMSVSDLGSLLMTCPYVQSLSQNVGLTSHLFCAELPPILLSQLYLLSCQSCPLYSSYGNVLAAQRKPQHISPLCLCSGCSCLCLQRSCLQQLVLSDLLRLGRPNFLPPCPQAALCVYLLLCLP